MSCWLQEVKKILQTTTMFNMITLQSKKVICFDVDDTLLLWNNNHSWGKSNKKAIKILDPYNPVNLHTEQYNYLYLKPNEEVIQMVKDYKAAGYTVVVWSAGGWLWAKTAVIALKLEEFVDLCMSKPEAYVDDNDATCWMGAYISVTIGGQIVHETYKTPDVIVDIKV